MNVREKLIELLESAESAVYWDSNDKGFIQKIADHLLANGVTIQSWIPVSERMPEEHDSIFARMYGTEHWIPSMFRKKSDEVLGIVRYEDGTTIVKPILTFDGEWAYARVLNREVTHWMPLPDPPQGVKFND